MRALLGVVAFVFLAACGGPPPPAGGCMPAFGAGAGPVGSGDEFPVAGDTFSVVMTIGTFCPTEISVTANVSVLDPSNMPLPLVQGETTRDVTDGERDMMTGMRTTIVVKAPAPGAYHFTTRFEPNLGLVQKDVLVAENLRDAGPELTVPGASGLAQCQHVDVTPLGRVLCLDPAAAVFGADGMKLQPLAGSGAATFAGNVVWTLENQTVVRWVESDAGFVGDVDGGAPLSLQLPVVLLPTADDVVAFNEFNEWWDAAGSLATRLMDVPPQQPLAGWRSGDRVLTVGTSAVCTGTFADAGIHCDQTGGGFPFLPAPFASDVSGIWAVAQNFTGTQTVTLFKPGSSHDFVLPTGWSVPDGGDVVAWDTSPVLHGPNQRVLLLTERSGSFVLQQFPEALQLISATGGHVALVDRNTSRVFIYKR